MGRGEGIVEGERVPCRDIGAWNFTQVRLEGRGSRQELKVEQISLIAKQAATVTLVCFRKELNA